jgi:hypothetical protein
VLWPQTAFLSLLVAAQLDAGVHGCLQRKQLQQQEAKGWFNGGRFDDVHAVPVACMPPCTYNHRWCSKAESDCKLGKLQYAYTAAGFTT